LGSDDGYVLARIHILNRLVNRPRQEYRRGERTALNRKAHSLLRVFQLPFIDESHEKKSTDSAKRNGFH
jgi:hypothetical protein